MAKGKGSSRGGGSKIGGDAGSGQFKQTKPKGRDSKLNRGRDRDAGAASSSR